jgi:hypothetical protein
MAKIGQAFTKSNVIELTTELITGTEHAAKLEAFKKKRNINARENNTVIVGDRWYRGFMK